MGTQEKLVIKKMHGFGFGTYGGTRMFVFRARVVCLLSISLQSYLIKFIVSDGDREAWFFLFFKFLPFLDISIIIDRN